MRDFNKYEEERERKKITDNTASHVLLGVIVALLLGGAI